MDQTAFLLQQAVNALFLGSIYALIALGYKPPEASRMVSKVFEAGMGTEAIIRAALQGTVK